MSPHFSASPRAGPGSVLGEEVFEVGLGEAAGEAFLAEDVRDGLGFALLQVPDFLLDGAGGDEAVGVDGAGLADAMGAVNGLRLRRPDSTMDRRGRRSWRW